MVDVRAPAAAMATALAVFLFPALARAQVNIDQGKSAAQIYDGVCAVCHKTPRGLAVGRNTASLASFLSQHYTASSGQAAALAAYVLASGGAQAAPKTAAREKPEADHPRTDEAKGSPRNTHPGRVEARSEEGGEAAETAKRDESARSREAKRAGETKPLEEAKPKDVAKREEHPGSIGADRVSPGHPESQPQTASREEKPSPAAMPPQGPATPPAPTRPAAAAPASSGQASAKTTMAAPAGVSTVAVPNVELGSTVTAVAPPPPEPGAGTNVPRDRIPD